MYYKISKKESKRWYKNGENYMDLRYNKRYKCPKRGILQSNTSIRFDFGGYNSVKITGEKQQIIDDG